MPSWAQREPPPSPPPVELMTDRELLKEWRNNTNQHRSVVVAHELARRQYRREFGERS